MAAKWLILDCEAYRTRNPTIIEKLSREALDAQPKQNVRKDLKMEWDSDESRNGRIQKALADTSKNPLYAEILCIAVLDDLSKHTIHAGMVRTCPQIEPNPETEPDFDWLIGVFDGMEQSRRDCLEQFADYIEKTCDKDTIFVGHNICRYDLPLIIVEWNRHRIKPPDCWPVFHRRVGAGRWSGRIFDTLMNCPSIAPFTGMEDALLIYGIDHKTELWNGEPMDGSRVGSAFEANMFEAIRRYCCSDVVAERNLFAAMTYNMSWGLWDRTIMVSEQLHEIAESNLTLQQKWIAAYPILQSAGLLP